MKGKVAGLPSPVPIAPASILPRTSQASAKVITKCRPMKGVQGSNLPAQIWREAMLATPRPRREGLPPAPATKPRQENGLEWLIDLVTGAVGGVTN